MKECAKLRLKGTKSNNYVNRFNSNMVRRLLELTSNKRVKWINKNKSLSYKLLKLLHMNEMINGVINK